MMELKLTLGDTPTAVGLDTVIVAGWTGRDRHAVEAHIAELELVGVLRPSSTPVFYRVSATRLVLDELIESPAAGSGEAEPVLLCHDDRLWVGVGSDHTDRDVERYSVAVSKQLCDKPIGSHWWPYDEVKDHWDALILRSWLIEDQTEILYQDGTVDALLPPDELLKLAHPTLSNGALMFCGTLAAIGGIRSSTAFRYELADPVLGRSLTAGYHVLTLPIVS